MELGESGAIVNGRVWCEGEEETRNWTSGEACAVYNGTGQPYMTGTIQSNSRYSCGRIWWCGGKLRLCEVAPR